MLTFGSLMEGFPHMVRFLLSFTLLSIVSCSDQSAEHSSVFFGGEIVNPTSDYVVLYHNDTYVDSVKLDKNNHFAFNLKGIEEGLYHFDHTPELQYVYLKEGDSLLARLNTVEFDESLVYSGEGSDINNFLIELFLIQEKDEPVVQSFYKLDPEVFSQKIDSLHAIQINHLKDFEPENSLSPRELTMAKASIDYNTFIQKEKYPYYHKKETGEEAFHNLPDSFYSYWNNLDFNNRDLTYLKPYFDFMKWHFGNLSYVYCTDNCSEEQKKVGGDRLHFNNHKLAMVDSVVQQTELRDILFRNIAMDYLLKVHNPSDEAIVFIDKFRNLSKNEAHKEEIDLLYKGIKNLQPNTTIPNLSLRDVENNILSIKDVTNKKKNTVFYFWTAAQERHFRKVSQQISDLEKKYPDHNFVGINLRTSYPQWQDLMKQYSLDKEKQYYGENFKEIQMAMIIDGLNKCVITKDSLVVDGFANLFTSL